MRSLKRRLLWILAGLTLLSWLGSAAVTVFYSSRVLQAQVDEQLEQYADLVSYIIQVFERQLEAGLPIGEPWLDRALVDGFDNPMVVDNTGATGVAPALNIWMGEQLMALLQDSPRFPPPVAPGYTFADPADNPAAGPAVGEQGHWRLLARRDAPSGLWIVVGIDMERARWSLLGGLSRVLLPLVVVLPLTLVVLYFGVQRGLRPLQTLASQISRRNPQLLEPVLATAAPEELAPVVASINDLLERLAHALESEQRFTANAAHELTTPLAAIKAEVQLCQRQLAEPRSRELLDRVVLRVDRAHHTVDQLLTLARLDPESPLPRRDIALHRLLEDVVSETAHLARERGLRLETGALGPAWVHGSEEALALLLRNLLVNAFRYASEGGAVTLSLSQAGGAVTLSVANDCAPLAAEEFRRLTERFYRVPGSRGAGAGLGLSIVSRVAELHGARFSAGPGAGGQGFVATLVFAGGSSGLTPAAHGPHPAGPGGPR